MVYPKDLEDRLLTRVSKPVNSAVVGAVEGAVGATAGSVARRLGLAKGSVGVFAPGPLAERMRDNPLMEDWETYWAQKNANESGDPNWSRSRARSMRAAELPSWVSSMNPDLPSTYKELGIPANMGVEKKTLPDGQVKYGNATWQDSPIYKSSPEFWDTYERWSRTPYEQVAEELQQSLGPNAVINEQAFRQKVNAYRQLVNSTQEAEKIQQLAEYPEDGGFVRDFKAYVDEWDRLDKSGGFEGGVKNWIEDVKLMGEGTYQVLMTLSGIQELQPQQTRREFGRELGESFTSGLAGGIAASLQRDPESGEMRVSRKPLILLGTVAPTMWNLAKAARGGYLSKPVAQQVDLLKKQDTRFAKAFNATLNAVDKVKSGVGKVVSPVTKPVSNLANKVADIELPSYIRKDKEVGRGDIDMPDQRGIKVDPDAPIDFNPDKLRPGSDRQLRTVGDVTRAALKDLGFWSITGLPFYNFGAAAGLIGAQGISRIGYGALLKKSPKALNAHRRLRQYFTRSGKAGALDNIDERRVDQLMRNFAESMQGQFSEDFFNELTSYIKARLKGVPVRAIGPDEIAGMDIPAEVREVKGFAYSEAVPSDQADRVVAGDFGPMVDPRLVRERERPGVAPERRKEQGQAVKIGQPSRASQELFDQKANLTSRLQEIEALLGAEESTSPVSVPLSRDKDRFGVTEAEKQYYPKPNETERTALAVDRVEVLDQLAEVNRAIEEAEAQPPSREVSAMDSPLPDDAVAVPEREASVVRVGDKAIESVTEAEGMRREFERNAEFVRQAAEEARSIQTPENIREQIANVKGRVTNENINAIIEHNLRAIDLAERTVIEEFRYRNNVPESVLEDIGDNINELTVEFADETVASLLDQGVGASGARGSINPIETRNFFGMIKENLKDQVNAARMVEETGFNQEVRKIQNTLKVFTERFTSRDIDKAIKQGGIEASFTPGGDLITGGPLFQLAQGQRGTTALRTRQTDKGKRVPAANQPTRQDLTGPQAEPLRPMKDIEKEERTIEDRQAGRDESLKVNMFNEETGMWDDVFVSYPDLNLSNVKFNEKRLQQLQSESGARDLQRVAIQTELGKKPTPFLIKSARARGLVQESEQKQFRLFVEENQTSSIANFRKKLIDKITNDRMKEDTGRLSFVRKLSKMKAPELNEFAAKQSPPISFKKTKTRPAIRGNANKVEHILAVLKRRRDKGIPEAEQKLSNLIRRRDELQGQIREADRQPIRGFDLDDMPARGFEQVERGLDRAELQSINDDIRRARSELNRAQERDRTIRLRDTDRGTKLERDKQKKLEKARKEVEDLSEQQVLEELFQYDPKTAETYRLKKTQRKGTTEPVAAITSEAPGRIEQQRLTDVVGTEEGAPLYQTETVPVQVGKPDAPGIEGTRTIPTAKEALARFKASGAKQSAATFKFKGSTQEQLAQKLLAKYEKRLKKERPAPEAPTDTPVGFDPKLDAALSRMAKAVPGTGPVASMVRMLRKYIETEGGQKAPFNVDRLNKGLARLEKTKKGESPVQLKQFDKRPKKQKTVEEKVETKAESKAEAKPKPQIEKDFSKLEKRVNDMYNAVIENIDSKNFKVINKALVPLQSVYGQVARLEIPLDKKRPLLEKLRDASQQLSLKKQSETFSAKFETITDELTALAEGEIIPELMSVSGGTFSKIKETFDSKTTGIFAKLNKAVKELESNATAATDANKAQANRNYVNGLDDRVSILARALEELEEGSVHAIADKTAKAQDFRFEAFDAYGPNMFMKAEAGKQASARMANAPRKGALARSFGLARLDNNYYLDVNWYRSRSDKRYVKSPDGPDLVPNEATEAAIVAEVIFRDMQKSRKLINEELAKAQQINSEIPGTREYLANEAAAVITDPTAKMPKNVSASFKREIYKLQRKVNNNETIPVRKTIIDINASDLSPAEKYALYRQVNSMHVMQESHGPGVVKSTGETRFEAQERAFMESPVVTNAAMILDDDGTRRPSKRMVVRLVRPWSKGFDVKMQRYIKKMEKLGRSEMERNAFVANVMEVFNQGNTLLMSDAFRGLVSKNVSKNISDQLVAAYATDATGKKRKSLSNTELENLEKNVNVFLDDYSLPFSGLPPAAEFSKGSVGASRMLASMPTKFEYRAGDVVLATADLINIIENSFDQIKSDQTKLLIMQDAARNLSGRLQSQAKSSAFVSMNNLENERFKINYLDSPLEALSKYTYYTVFRNEARPQSLAYALADVPGETAVSYASKSKILDSYSGKFDEFVETIQEVYHQDLRQIFKDKYNESYVKITPEIIEQHNKKHGTSYTSRLTKQQIEAAFGSLDTVEQSSPVGRFIRDMEQNTFTLNNMSKTVKLQEAGILSRNLERFTQPEATRASALQKEIQEAMPLTSSIYSELSDLGVTDAPSVVDSQITISPQALSTDNLFNIPMNKGFIESVAWDAQLSRDMQGMIGKTTSIMKAGLTVRSAITQLGNIVGNSLAISMTTGETMAGLSARVARTEQIFYAHAKNPKGFLSAAQRSKLDKDALDIVEAVESISANTALDAMDSFNVEIGTAARRSLSRLPVTGIDTTKAGLVANTAMDLTFAAPKQVMKLQDFMYKQGDAAPRRAEVLREYLEGRQLLDAMEPGSAASFRVSRKGYTTFYKDNKGIYQLSRNGKKTYSDVRKNGSNDFTSKVLASHAVQKVSGRIFNYRNVPRFIESIRSGGLGAVGSLFFSQFISFPYLAVDGFGKKGLLASTVFEPFFDNDVITNSKNIMLQKSYNQTLRGVRRGMVLTAFQSMRYPESEALQEDSKFRRDVNTLGAVLPARSSEPGFYKYFSWANANGFETSIGLLNYALGMQAYLASLANKATGKDADNLNEFGKTMLAQVAAKERGQTKELLDLMTFGGSIVSSFIVDYNKDYGQGNTYKRLLATAIGKDQSRFLNALLTQQQTITPADEFSVYRQLMQEQLVRDDKAQWANMSSEEKNKFLNDNFWPVIFNMRFKERPIVEPRKIGQPARNKAIDAFVRGLEETLYEGIIEGAGKMEPSVFAKEELKPKLVTARDQEEKDELNKLRADLEGDIEPIVKSLQTYYVAIDNYDRRKKAYESALLKGESKNKLARRRNVMIEAEVAIGPARKEMRSARARAAELKRKADKRKQTIKRQAEDRAR